MRESLQQSRMTLSHMNHLDPNGRELRLWLLSANTHHGVTYYRITGRFTSSGQTWEVSHRYSEFLKLRDQLVKFLSTSTDKCPGCRNYLHSIQRFAFPKKHLFASRAPPVVNYRVKALRSFVNLLASWAFSKTPKCPTCGGYAFDVVRNFVLEGNALSAGTDMNLIRESMTVKAFAKNSLPSSRGPGTPSWIKPSSSGDLDMTQSMYVLDQSPSTSEESKKGRLTQEAILSEAPLSQSRQHKTLNKTQLARAQERQLKERNYRKPSTEHYQQQQQRRRHHDDDVYDAFNDYLPEKQSKIKKATQSSMEQKVQRGKFTSRPLQESVEERQQRHQHKEAETNVCHRKLQKHRSEPRNLAARHLLAESELSMDTDVLQHPRCDKRVVSRSNSNAESFMSDVSMAAEPICLHGDELQRYRLADDEWKDKSAISSVYSGDDELELTGVTMAPPLLVNNKRSIDNLWEPWELAKVS